ncbi:non-ribosomal peptide synthetase [Nostoc commune]|uniref:non-ribosomal peptide synthetase n=1 Tax=Nostoc commune TaxID=1178 RepID=UPI0018C4E0A3|nr:non-ribosomal peptide synthetase [Nostoc commune]
MNPSQETINNQLNQRIAALTPEQKALFEQLKRQQVKSKLSIPRRGATEELPLSLAQERLWFLHQLDPNNPAYNIAIAWELEGKLDIPILLASLQIIGQRQEVLRTAFTSFEGKPCQKIAPTFNLKLPVIDLQALPPSQQQQQSQRLATSEASQAFDLSVAPLMRVTLIRLAPQRTTLLLTIHHIIADGWSRGILLRELAQCYRALALRQNPSLTKLPIQYADFALWQRQWLQGEEMKAQLAYWQKQLADLPILELPTDLPRSPLQQFRGATQSELLPRSLLESLKHLAKQQGVTLFMLLLAAFKVLLHRYCGQDEIVLGVPSANRNRSEVEPLIGFFVNTLVLRTDLSGNPSFHTVMERVRTTAAEAFKHQDVPFAKVVEALHPERDLSHNPLVQVMFQVQNEAYQLQNDSTLNLLPDLQIQQSWVETGSTKFDLTCHLVERSQGLLVVLEYCTDLFHQQTIARMIQHLRVLLTAIVTDSQQRLSELPILTAQERRQILEEWNQTQVNYPQQWLHQQFEAQVEKTPENVAVISPHPNPPLAKGREKDTNTLLDKGREKGSNAPLAKGREDFPVSPLCKGGLRGVIPEYKGEEITYSELNSKANQLAHYLRSQGITTESLVGIYLERSPQLIIALLAVLKASGAYIPLDSKLPRDRLAYMLADAQPAILLTTDAFADQLPHSCQVVCLDNDWPIIAQNPEHNLVNLVGGDNLAYIIYTSGSTGTPKGTMLTHRGLANYLNWAIRAYPLTAGTGVPVQSSISFDATITSLYSPLLVGKPLVLLPEAEEIEALSNALNSQTNFSLVKLTPAHLGILRQLLPQKTLFGYPQALIIGGEALSKQHLEFWQTNSPQTKLINEYGPTETVVGCCTYDATKTPATSNNIPIGRPIANTQLYILDCYLQPVPVGVPGELYIGGDGVARGYLNQPELTAAKFLANPFISEWRMGSGDEEDLFPMPNAQCPMPILYKTGDRARYLADGNIEYLGRLDNQVKIRGFRVELGEIEAVLQTHPLVQEAVVVTRKENPNHPQLIAYIVRNQQNLELTDFRQYLAAKLPAYMLPSAFVYLDKLPLTTNGKVDLTKLPPPEIKQQQQAAPRTPIETILVQIWTELLGYNVGISDNFFEQGGDSILSIQMVAKANQLGVKLTPKQLFQHQTIAQLATVIQMTPQEQAEQGKVTGTVFLTPIQHWLFEQNLHKLDYFNQAIMLEVEPNLQADILQQAIEQLLIHHDMLRSRFIQQADQWQQHISASIDHDSLTVVDLVSLPKNTQQHLMESTASQLQASLDLATGNLLRVALFRLGNGQSDRLLLIIHHLVVDGISWRILLEDLLSAYQQLKAKESVQLPAKTTSFPQWAQQLQNYAQSAELREELTTWLKILPRESPPLPLDYEYHPNVNTIASENQISVNLDATQTRALLEEVPKAYHTQINDVLLTSLVQSMSQWTLEHSLLVDLEGHGREDLFANTDISRTVGWFTTIFPVYLKLDNSNSLGANLKYVKEQLRQIPKKGIGYGLLRYLSSDKAFLSYMHCNTPPALSRSLTPLASPVGDAARTSRQSRPTQWLPLARGGLGRGLQLPQSDISFNYLGQLDLFSSQAWIHGIARESTGLLSHSQNSRHHKLNVTAWIAQSQLNVQWRYSRNLHDAATIERIAQQFIKALQTLIQHCQSPTSGGYTPSDFTGARLNQKQLDQFLSKLQQPKKG